MLFALTAGIGVVHLDNADVSEFVSTKTGAGTPVHWANTCVFVRPSAAVVSDLPADQIATAIADATAAWPAAASGCGYLRFMLETPETGEVGLDYVNRIVFREVEWCRPGPPKHCYDRGATAITTLFFVDKPGDPRDGEILDADIEVNAVDYAFAVCNGNGCASAGTGPIYDLPNILTHEFGHVLGLDHTCWDGSGAQPTDGEGNPVPPCAPVANLPAGVVETTMFPFADPMETKKRTLEADDVAGLCGKYPLAADPNSCAPVTPPADSGDAGVDPTSDAGTPTSGGGGGCGCRTQAPSTSALSALALLVVVLRVRRRA